MRIRRRVSEFPAELTEFLEFCGIETAHGLDESLHVLREKRREPCFTGRRKRRNRDTAVRDIAITPDQTVAFEIVEHGGQVAGADKQFARQRAVRHRPQMRQHLEHTEL